MSGNARADKIGFVGMGVMGGGMAANLLKNGFTVVGYDVSPARNDYVAGLGAEIVDGPAAVARAASKTICMVETTVQAESVIVGEGGIVDGAEKGDIHLCMSTIDPLSVKRMHGILAARGIAMIDAPVSGGQPRAESGDLSAMVGGDVATVEACRPELEAMTRSIFHMGDIGQGTAMKLVNNMLNHTTSIVVAEAMVMGAKAGLDPQAIIDVIGVSTGNSEAFASRAPRFVSRDFSPGGTVDICYKDQELGTAFARALGVPVLLANVSEQVYAMGHGAGLGKEDSSALVKLYEEWAGVTLGPKD
jgi:3-hydroxyisobutyrate dehydrogenase